jgi:hypothetical protein
MSYASNTNVSEDRSRQEIERLLMKYGADEFGYLTRREQAMIGFVYRGLRFEMSIPLPNREDKQFCQTPTRGTRRTETAAMKEYQQEVRRRWRSLCLAVKAKLVAVEDGVMQFEAEFMPYLVLGDGRTMHEHMLPRIEAAIQSGQPLKLLA